jgi:copper chaperone CopZ
VLSVTVSLDDRTARLEVDDAAFTTEAAREALAEESYTLVSVV